MFFSFLTTLCRRWRLAWMTNRAEVIQWCLQWSLLLRQCLQKLVFFCSSKIWYFLLQPYTCCTTRNPHAWVRKPGKHQVCSGGGGTGAGSITEDAHQEYAFTSLQCTQQLNIQMLRSEHLVQPSSLKTYLKPPEHPALGGPASAHVGPNGSRKPCHLCCSAIAQIPSKLQCFWSCSQIWDKKAVPEVTCIEMGGNQGLCLHTHQQIGSEDQSPIRTSALLIKLEAGSSLQRPFLQQCFLQLQFSHGLFHAEALICIFVGITVLLSIQFSLCFYSVTVNTC